MFCNLDVLLMIKNCIYSGTKREMSGSYQNEEILRAMCAACVVNSLGSQIKGTVLNNI